MIRAWVADTFWSRRYKAKAAFNRGLVVGALLCLIAVSILTKVFA